MKLPHFKYHPDPVATGSVEESDEECACCEKARGFLYTGPVFGDDDGPFCPWCIADGSAHDEMGATFQDEDGIGGYGDWGEASAESVEEVSSRTPGFTAWQQASWWVHCGEAAQYLGRAGRAELDAAGPEAVESVRTSAETDWDAVYPRLHRYGDTTAYLFKCGKCGRLGGYWDSN